MVLRKGADQKHGHIQFEGDGSRGYPDLFNRDILFTQSFQLSDTDVMACVYVPTLNYEPHLPEETDIIRWSGGKWGAGSRVAYRDLCELVANTVLSDKGGAL